MKAGTIGVVVGLLVGVITYAAAYADAWLDVLFNPWLRTTLYTSVPWWSIFTTNHYFTLVWLFDPILFYEVAVGAAVVFAVIGGIAGWLWAS